MAIVLKKNLIADLLKIKEILKTRMKLCERKITTDLPKKKTPKVGSNYFVCQ